jgi:hypothetical protein
MGRYGSGQYESLRLQGQFTVVPLGGGSFGVVALGRVWIASTEGCCNRELATGEPARPCFPHVIPNFGNIRRVGGWVRKRATVEVTSMLIITLEVDPMDKNMGIWLVTAARRSHTGCADPCRPPFPTLLHPC